MVFAQSDTSSISGTVTDPSGAVVPNAKVTIEDEATKNQRVVTSTSVGLYTVSNLPPGNYRVKVEAQGFQGYVQQGAHVDPGVGARVDVTLQLGSSATTVNVTADANTIQTETAAVGQLVTQQQVASIQLNGRNPMYLAQLEPGVRRGAAMSSFNFSLDNSLNINGSRTQDNVMTLDGSPMVRTRANNDSIGVVDVDATAEMQVLTGSYPAEYGRASGGQIRIVPKGGSSEFHGAAFEYLRNSFFNANTWQRGNSTDPLIADHPPAFRYNQFGYNLNGPAAIPGIGFNKDRRKLFFLVGEEWVKYRHEDTVTRKVPTALMRTGNFSELLNPNNIFYGKTVQIHNPKTGAPYAGNVIPASDLSANGLGLLNAYPEPNISNPSYNWEDAAPYPENQRKDTFVIDFDPADKHHFRVTVLNFNYNSVEPHYGNFNRTPEVWDRPNQVGTLHYTWTINPTMVNEVFGSVSADHVKIGYDLSSGLYDRTKYGINYPYLYAGSDKEIPNKIPTIEIANFDTLDGGPYPSHSGGVIWDFSDNFTKVLGRHTLKAGFLYEHESENDFDQINVSSTTPGATNNQNGLFTFTDTRSNKPTTDAAVANAAAGLFDTYGEIGLRSYTIFQGNMYEWFVQDQWRATPKLVLEYGIRHSILQPYGAKWGNQSVFDPRSYDPSTAPAVDPVTGFTSGGDPYDGVVIPGSGFPGAAKGHLPDSILNGQYSHLFKGYSAGYTETDWKTFQPRVGITYALSPHSVFRAGGGRFITRLGVSDSVHLGGNPPFQPSAIVSYGAVNNPGGAGQNNYPLNMTSEAYHFPSPEAWGWTATFEQEVPKFAVFTLGYVGRRGLRLQHLENINQLEPGTTYANADVTPDALRPYKGFSSIQQETNDGKSTYHSLQANLKRRVTKGLLFGVAYTWSKSLDNASDPGTNIPNYYDPNQYWGPSDFDTRHSLVVNYVWDVPVVVESGIAHSLVRGWQISGTTQFQSGEPLSVSTGDDFAGVGPGSGNQLWAKNGKLLLLKKSSPNNSNGNLWFNAGIFGQPAAGTFAPAETRNQIYGPGFQSWNLALQRSFPLIPGHENHQLRFRAEAFNFTNHPNLDNPDVDPTSSTFGKVTQKGTTYDSERQMQFSLRYQF